MHKTCTPAILYFGTPVVLISTINEDGTINLAPMSSIFWLGWRCVIGLGRWSKTTDNLIRTQECVLNLPSVNEVNAVDKLALTTGSTKVPAGKIRRGYTYVPNKFEIAGVSSVASEVISTPGVLECPVCLEAIVREIHAVGEDDAAIKGRIVNIELEVVNVRLHKEILQEGKSDQIDPNKWKPLIMSFQHFYGLGDQIQPSRLAEIPEKLYRMD